ncbi:MAG: MG2 domain-containing protein [Weeksellaceae bacterium]
MSTKAQNYPYDKKWKEVDNQLSDGKLKTIKSLLDDIYTAAKKEKQSEHLIKALIYKSNIAVQTSDDEDIVLETQQNFQQEIAAANPETKSILQSLLAQLYFDYYRENLYRIINRTDLNVSSGSDFRTWDSTRFLTEIDTLLQESVQPQDNLNQISIDRYQILLEGDAKWRFLRPQLFDLLANRALNIYQSDVFENQSFNQTDRQDRIKDLYNSLVKIHQTDQNKSALIEAELQKIKYDYNHQLNSIAYQKALENLYNQYQGEEWSTNILYELALTYANNSEEDNDYARAIALANEAIDNFPQSHGAAKAKNLIERIESPNLSFSTDESLYADQPNVLYISHQNTDKVYYRIYKVGLNDLNQNSEGFQYDYNKNKLQIIGQPFKSGEIELKQFTDYKTHTTKTVVDPLPAGNYIILLADNTSFNSQNKNQLFQQSIHSSKIELSSRNDQDGRLMQLVQKDTGLPMANHAIQIFKSVKNSAYQKFKEMKTDDLGRFSLDLDTQDYYTNYVMKAQGEDVYFPIQISYRNNQNRTEQWSKESAFFTDRGIYRPGQTVYFKSILYQSLDHQKKVAANEKVTMTLKDVNGKEVSTLDLVSNEFGSVHGEFTLPSSGITGNYQIHNDWSKERKFLRVEEYKRPKFEVKIDSLKGIYLLNENVKVTGKADMFSGANVSNAKVVYRVYRQAYHPYRYWWRPYQPQPEVEITQGETTTDNQGQFSFDFVAEPANNQNNREKRAYEYKIIADVIDISGETHTTESRVRIGDIPFSIQLEVENRIESKDFNHLKIKTTNLNGLETELEGTLEVTAIQPLDRVLRDQQQEVEYELLPKNQFVQKLPYIAYNNEHRLENRKRGTTVLKQNWNTANKNKVQWNQNLKPGLYEVKATSIYKNDTITSIQFVEVFDKKEKTKSATYFDLSINQKTYEPGDKATVILTSDASMANALIELEVNGKIIQKEVLKLNNTATFTFPIKEEYRGNVYVHAYFNKFNESTALVETIEVPYTNKELDITTSTFRTKLEPGQEEKWTLTIKDKKGDKILAEVLAGMYDKSLDQFTENDWSFNIYSDHYSQISPWSTQNRGYFRNYSNNDISHEFPWISYEDLNLYGLSLNEFSRNQILIRGMKSAAPQAAMESTKALQGKVAGVEVKKEAADASPVVNTSAPAYQEQTEEEEAIVNNIQARKNLEETAFFFPNLKTDKNGNVKIEFTTPESLTTWNMQTVAHTKDLKIGTFQSDVVTQKELMVVPNAPRFLREGDVLKFQSKIINLSDKDLNGNIQLELLDAFTMQPIEGKFNLKNKRQRFLVNSDESATASWTLHIPKVDQVQSVVYRIVAQSGSFSDGEESALPILTNRTLVTETMPMSVRENETKTFTFDKLQNTKSTTRDDFKLTMEMTTNPIWYAVMALPYLRESNYENSEAVFARLYGNMISQHIVNSNPKIKAVFDDWNQKGTLISPLEKNEELKNILLAETPWVRQAQSESEQMKRIAILFDLNKMRQELKEAYNKLEQKQSPSGGFPWYEGGRENAYITTHIVAGFGHLDQMNLNLKSELDTNSEEMLSKAIKFIDHEMEERWTKFQADKKRYPLSNFQGLYWLYARSYHLDSNPLSAKMSKARDYFLTELNQDKFKQNIQTQAMLSLVLNRYGKSKEARDLIFAIKDRAVESDEMGMYWKENVSGYGWNEAPVETQALIIEAFDEITPEDVTSIESMKVWLLKNKQTNQWNSTKATTEAVYALMNTGKDWANAEEGVNVKIGNTVWYDKNIKPSNDIQSGSGYVKESWNKSEIKPELGTVEIKKTTPGVAWGAMYWQYFEDLDKISSANTNVKFRKQLWIQRNTDQGPKLFEISEDSQIQVGDLVKVRLEIQTDRAMEFVHIKDMRASGFEPVNVLSQYKWQDGLGYYESTRDASTNFFIDYLPKGVYVFEYDLRANNAGTFSNGITQLQNLYAPELSAHSEGIKVEIE